MSRRLIITADDYGMCESVNEAIEECIAAGTVRATCVMANMPACEAAGLLRRRFPKSSVGIHWNLTQGRPVLPLSQVASLVNHDGCFYSPSEFKQRWWTRKIELQEVRSELRAQFDRVSQLTGPPDFWNTHQDSHMFPGLFQAFVTLGRRLGIPAMRCYRRITVPRGSSATHYHVTHPSYWLKSQLISWWSSRAAAGGTSMPDARIYPPGYDAGSGSIEEVIRRVPWSKVKHAAELVIHPATSVDHALFGRLIESRLVEYQTFRDPHLANRLQQTGIEPVGFDALSWDTRA